MGINASPLDPSNTCIERCSTPSDVTGQLFEAASWTHLDERLTPG